MCLIAVIPARKDRTRVSNAWLEDVFRRNSDGFGFMWSDRGRAKATRAVGTVDEFKTAFRKHERHTEGEFAFHLRYKTHGKVDVTNAHPYPVDTQRFGRASIYMMHNGILHTGNSVNPAMSDTWHFINDYIRGMVTEFGEKVLFRPEFRKLVEEMIGSNRFVFLGRSGVLNVYNRHQGITWRGMWLSNTYAWSAEKFGAAKPRIRPTGHLGTGMGGGLYGTYDGARGARSSVTPLSSLSSPGAASLPKQGVLALPAHKSASDSAAVFAGSGGWNAYDYDEDTEDDYGLRDFGLRHSSSLGDFSRGCQLVAQRQDETAALHDDDDDTHEDETLAGWRSGIAAQLVSEATSFIYDLNAMGYSATADSLSVGFVAKWIKDIGWTEYRNTVDDIGNGLLDPDELFAGLVSDEGAWQ